MHGRIKVRTTAEQEEIKKKERAAKVAHYKAGINEVFAKRHKGEKDESGLAISAKLLGRNPDIYTLWNIRREIILYLKTVKSDDDVNSVLEDELRLTEVCLRTQPKSYGTWHHRCWVLDQMTNPPWKTELALCNKYLEYDERNFHCWDYRRFVVDRSGITAKEELEFTSEKIATNFSNYSAWHLRTKLLPQVFPDTEGLKPIEENQHKLELELVTNAAFTDPYDQSAWFYQRWLLGRTTPELRITQVIASKKCLCVSFNQSVSPSSVTVSAFGDQPWETVNSQASSYVWKKAIDATSLNDVVGTPIGLHVDGNVKTLGLKVEGDFACYEEKLQFQAGFSPGVTRVLQDVLESCQTLLQLEPDTKWPLLTSVLLMQAIDNSRYKENCLHYLDMLAKIDYLRANYYSDLRSRYIMEDRLEELSSDVCLKNSKLTALYHSQYLLPALRVDLSCNTLGRSLPLLSSLQFCKVLVLDENNLQNLKGFPDLPHLVTLSLKRNHFQLVEDVEPHIKKCSALMDVHIDENPLAATHEFFSRSFRLKDNITSKS